MKRAQDLPDNLFLRWALGAEDGLRYAGLKDGEVVDSLVAQGLARAEEDPATTGRAGWLYLTDAGVERARQLVQGGTP